MKANLIDACECGPIISHQTHHSLRPKVMEETHKPLDTLNPVRLQAIGALKLAFL